MNTTLQILLTVIGGMGAGALVAAINAYAQRKKVTAEAKKTDITGELELGEGWKNYANTLREDLHSLRNEMQGMDERHKREIQQLKDEFKEENRLLKLENGHLRDEVDALTVKNKNLESQIAELTEQLLGKSDRVDEAKDVLHQEVDKQLEKVKHPSDG